jgi:hypothetical protein
MTDKTEAVAQQSAESNKCSSEEGCAAVNGECRKGCIEGQTRLRAVLRELVEACAYVKPFAGEVLSEGENVTVKKMREAMRFCAAVEAAQKLLGDE